MHKIFQIVILFTSTFHWTKTFKFRSFWTYSNFFLGFFQHTQKKMKMQKVRSNPTEKYSGLAILWRPWKGRWWCCPFSLSPPSWRSIEDCTWNYPALGGKCHVVFIQKMHKELIVMCSNGKKMCTYILCVYVMFDYLYTLYDNFCY